MNVYPIKVKLSGKEDTTLTLRLDSRGCHKLTEKYKKDVNDLLTEALTNQGLMADILDTAIHHKHNNNPRDIDGEPFDGFDVYDALVDSGKQGTAAWMEVSMKLAEVSGIASKDLANALINQVRREELKTINDLKSGELSVKGDKEPAETPAVPPEAPAK